MNASSRVGETLRARRRRHAWRDAAAAAADGGAEGWGCMKFGMKFLRLTLWPRWPNGEVIGWQGGGGIC